MPIPDERAVRSAVTLFTTQLRGDIQAYLTRSAKYKKMIDKVLVENGLPKGLAYLPVIESGYSTTMTSRAGARGVWQFMGETAREYGLRVDWWVDERCDPERSTRAAAQYLKDLYREFNDWPLVLAAYNAGPGRIRRAVANSGASSFWLLDELPKETRGYVPTFYATLLIASDPANYGFQLSDPIDSDVKRVAIEGPVSLRFLAEAIHFDEGTLRNLNPMLRRGVVPPGMAEVRVPARLVDVIQARAKLLRNDDPHVAVCTYTVRDRDTLKRLAKAIGTTPQTILAMNGIRRLHRGESIYLPVRATELSNLLSGRRKPRPGEHTLTGGGM